MSTFSVFLDSKTEAASR